MNRNELVTQTQLNIKTLNEILDGLSIPKNTEDFTEEHLKLVQAIQEIRKDEKVQSWPEAIAIYRTPINEHQLKEIALRHEVADERIPDILKAMKLKVESLAEPQFELFRQVCQAMQSGMEMTLAAQMTLDKAKEAKTQKPTATSAAKSEPAPATAIATTAASNGKMSAQANGQVLTQANAQTNGRSKITTALVNETGTDLRSTAQNEAGQIKTGIIEAASDGIFNASDNVIEQAMSFGESLFYEELGLVMADQATIEANRQVIEAVKKRRRPASHS